jgi:TRAP-type transport system periplasmic protein
MTANTTRRSLALGLAAIPLFSIGKARAAEITLRFASINVAGTAPYEKALVPFAQNVEADSGGRIAVALKPIGGYGKASDLFNMTERGDIEIAATVQGYNPGRFPRSSVMELPLMFESGSAGTQALWKLFTDGDVAADYTSVKVLGLYVLPPYAIFADGKKINQLKDLRGLRIRTPSPTVGLALSRLGAIPVGVPVDMIGEMLASHTINAITYGWDSLLTGNGAGGKKLVEQVDMLLDANFAAPALMVVMNRAKWESLPADLQAIIDKHSPILTNGNAKVRDEAEGVAKARLKVDPRCTYRGLSADEQAEMAKTIAPAVAEWKAGMARQGIDGDALYEKARTLAHQFQTAAR